MAAKAGGGDCLWRCERRRSVYNQEPSKTRGRTGPVGKKKYYKWWTVGETQTIGRVSSQQGTKRPEAVKSYVA